MYFDLFLYFKNFYIKILINPFSSTFVVSIESFYRRNRMRYTVYFFKLFFLSFQNRCLKFRFLSNNVAFSEEIVVLLVALRTATVYVSEVEEKGYTELDKGDGEENCEGNFDTPDT